VRKSDNNRIALVVGATIVNRVEDMRESDVGTECGLFHIEKIGDELRGFFFSQPITVTDVWIDTLHILPSAYHQRRAQSSFADLQRIF
jgi:chaperonin GroEL (HSP60 family)